MPTTSWISWRRAFGRRMVSPTLSPAWSHLSTEVPVQHGYIVHGCYPPTISSQAIFRMEIQIPIRTQLVTSFVSSFSAQNLARMGNSNRRLLNAQQSMAAARTFMKRADAPLSARALKRTPNKNGGLSAAVFAIEVRRLTRRPPAPGRPRAACWRCPRRWPGRPPSSRGGPCRDRRRPGP